MQAFMSKIIEQINESDYSKIEKIMRTKNVSQDNQL